MNTAIIVAAGDSTRFGTDTPKQFIDIAGKPLIVHTLEVFEQCGAINDIVLVLSAPGCEYFERKIGRDRLGKLSSVVQGGNTRARSVKNGLDVIDRDKCELIAVHD